MTPEEEKDLNMRAYLALGDVFSKVDGEDHIAALLLSDAPIDPIVRTALGQALSANGVKPSGVRLELTKLKASKEIEKFRTRREWLLVGRDVLSRVGQGLTRTAAEEEVVRIRKKGGDWVKKATDYARDFENWRASLPREIRKKFYEVNLETIFHSASVRKVSPEEHFVDIMKSLKSMTGGVQSSSQGR